MPKVKKRKRLTVPKRRGEHLKIHSKTSVPSDPITPPRGTSQGLDHNQDTSSHNEEHGIEKETSVPSDPITPPSGTSQEVDHNQDTFPHKEEHGIEKEVSSLSGQLPLATYGALENSSGCHPLVEESQYSSRIEIEVSSLSGQLPLATYGALENSSGRHPLVEESHYSSRIEIEVSSLSLLPLASYGALENSSGCHPLVEESHYSSETELEVSSIPDQLPSVSCGAQGNSTDCLPQEEEPSSQTKMKVTSTPLVHGSWEANLSLNATQHLSNGNFEDIAVAVRSVLPGHWIAVVLDGNLHLIQMSRSECKTAQRDVLFTPTGQLKVFIHGRQLCETHDLIRRLPGVCSLSADTFNFCEYVETVKVAFNVVRSYEVCCGVEKEEYRPYAKRLPGSFVDHNLFLESRHKDTIRSETCLQVVPSTSILRCSSCAKLRSVLSKRCSAAKTTNRNGTPKAKSTLKTMGTPQMRKRAKRFAKVVKNMQMKIRRLKSRIERLIQREGVTISRAQARDFTAILEGANLTPFQQLFFEQQLKAASRKKTGMRWHPALIRLALHIRSLSGAAYEELGKVLRLPSERTLFEYSHAFQQTDGCNKDIVTYISKQLDGMKHYQRYFVLLWDEMHIKKGLVFRKTDGEMVGYVKQDNVEKEIEVMENILNSTVEGAKKLKKTDRPLASTMLSFLARGTANRLKQVVATYPCHSLTADFLYRKLWEVVGYLEEAKIFVMGFVCDGCAVNRRLYKMLAPFPQFMSSDSKVDYVVVNLFAPERPIFLFSDYIHLLKTFRNSLKSSGKKKNTQHNKRRKAAQENSQNILNTAHGRYKNPLNKRLSQYVRLMIKNGQEITWDTVVRLYESTKNDTVRKTYKLNAADVYINSYSAMNVSHAAHVMSRSLAEAVREEGWENLEEFCEFITTVNDVIDCLNGSHSYQTVHTRQELFAKYEDPDDPRFDFLHYVIHYFRQWEAEIQRMEGISPENKAKMIVSRQNLEGLEMTLRSFIGGTRFLLQQGTVFVMGRIFCQDDLENYHSKQRAANNRGGSNPTADDFIRNQTAMFTHSTLGFGGRRRGNAGASTTELSEELMQPVPKRAKTSRKKVNRNLMESLSSASA